MPPHESLDDLAQQALERAYELLSDPRRWTRGAAARDGRGSCTPATDPSAERWCAIGAIDRTAYEVCQASGVGHDHMAVRYVREAAQRRLTTVMREAAAAVAPQRASYIKTAGIPQFNDSITWGYQVVISAFSQATGKGVTAAIARSVERARRLRAAALKGWETRRRIERERWEAQRAERLAILESQAQQPPMSFGGTINNAPAAESKEEARVLR